MALLSPAKVLLLAVQTTNRSDIASLRILISQYPKSFNIELVLRILLTCLPESLESAIYVPFLKDLVSGDIREDAAAPIDGSVFQELSEDEAKHKARKLHLLPLLWPHHSLDVPADPLVRFLVHRSLRIDQNTGLISQIADLLTPFLQQSTYLRTWFITSILPLLRLNYEYYHEENVAIGIRDFEELSDRAGLNVLLSRTGRNHTKNAPDLKVGRDLRGLVGPWMYGDTRWKRRKLLSDSTSAIASVDEGSSRQLRYLGWEEVFKWITEKAVISWEIAVEAVEQWDGPGDIDTGNYADGSTWLEDDDQQHLEVRYARSILAAAYLIPEQSVEALNGVQRMLDRFIALMDENRIPSLQQAAALLQPVSTVCSDIVSPSNTTFLRSHLLEEQNIVTTPNEASVQLLHALLISAFICSRAGSRLSVSRAGHLAFLQDEREQKLEFANLMVQVSNGPKGEDNYWVKMRNEILWLRNWGADDFSAGGNAILRRGILGSLTKEFIEIELLKTLLNNTRYTLAKSIYETSQKRPLSKEVLQGAVVAAAMNAYDNATNANKTRGGVKQALEILNTFTEILEDSPDARELEHLIEVTHLIGKHKLAFKQGEPFKPVTLRVLDDPVRLIGMILEQNPKCYAQISDVIDIGRGYVNAGLTSKKRPRQSGIAGLQKPQTKDEQMNVVEKRIISMCITAALDEHDFETAYSYVVTRLQDVGTPIEVSSWQPERNHSGLHSYPTPNVIDDWSWKAALQTGKYRRSSKTLRPTHLGNASANPDIRHLEQRMECLSQALRLAPKVTLQEILNVYRRCEEELESQYKREAEQEDAWDTEGDNAMPGGFTSTPAKKSSVSRVPRGAEEAPMSLFDLSRASMARAQNGLSSLAMARSTQQKPTPNLLTNEEISRVGSQDSGAPSQVRKRDQLRNAAVGGLASGVGWILGAPPVKNNSNNED